MSRSRLKTALLALLIIAVAVGITVVLIKSKKAPEKSAHRAVGTLVELAEVALTDHQLTIRASGTVQARQQIGIEPQVSGRVVAVGKNFASGAFFRRGELLVQLEKTDYRLAVDQAEAALARAEVELATTESQAAIARQEWEQLGLQSEEDANPLALYQPQLKQARANIASAQATLEQARLNLERTTLSAPFAGRLLSEQVDVGQYLRAGSNIATLSGSDEVEVIVSVPMDDLQWLQIPGAHGGKGSPATVTLPGDPAGRSWQGVVDRSLGQVDARGRMLQVAVRVADPYLLKNKAASPPYLEVGMFVDVRFDGPLLQRAIVLPRRALRDGQTMWIAEAGELRIRPVIVSRLEREQVVLAAGVQPGEQVILTTLTGVADGMKLRIADNGETE